nr:hypothetical protein [Tanacetum cinerariifolium]
DFTKDVVENISPMKEPQVVTVLPTHPTLQLNLKFQPSSESLFAHVVWIFLPFLVYSVVSPYLLSLRTEDIIFDPGICKSTFSKPAISHRCRTVKKFNTHHGNTGILNIKMMGDISDQKVPIPNLMITHVSSQEKSPDLLPHQGLEAFRSSAECPVMINGKNTPILDVPLFHFYPLDQLKYGGN